MNRIPIIHAAAAVAACFLAFPGDAQEDEPRMAREPSETERRVSRAIAFAYLRNADDLEKEYLYFKGLDNFLRERGHPPTGLSDNLLDLMLSSVADYDEFLDAQRAVLGASPDKLLQERVQFRLEDEAMSADSLIVTDRYNRFAFIFNTFVRPLSLLAVGYFPALIDAGVATLLNLDRLTDLSVEERKALVLYQRFLERYPDSDKAEILRRRIAALDRKRLHKSHDAEIAAAGDCLAKEDYWQAQQHFKNALAYRPDSAEAAAGLSRTRSLEAERNALRAMSLTCADAGRESAEGEEGRGYMAVLYAVAAGNPEAIVYEAERFLEKNPRSPHAPHARYAIAVAHDMSGAHEKAMELMREILREYPASHIGKHAEAYLADPDYNPRLAFQRSRVERRARTARFVLLGEEFVKSNLILSSSRIITQGLQAVQSLGTFNVLAMIIRGANTLMRNPISDQEIIDAGIAYLRRYPDCPSAPSIHYVLAGAYEKRQNLAKALYHYEASGMMSERQLSKLRERAARQYLDFAEATASRDEKIRCYETILDEYPGTKSAVTALEQLALCERREEPLFEIDKDTLAANPILFRLTALNITPDLLDGDPANGELAPRGLYSSRRGAITVVHADKGGDREQTINLDYPTYKGLMAYAQEMRYRKRLAARGDAPAGGKFPVELRGTVGNAGVFVYPRLKVREYRDKDLYLYQ